MPQELMNQLSRMRSDEKELVQPHFCPWIDALKNRWPVVMMLVEPQRHPLIRYPLHRCHPGELSGTQSNTSTAGFTTGGTTGLIAISNPQRAVAVVAVRK